MSLQVSASILSADFAQLGAEVIKVTEAGADYIHIDAMDGKFVPNITIGPLVVEAIKHYSAVPLDVHLMIESPSRYIEAFAQAGADIITIHAEAEVHLERAVKQIKACGKKAGVSLVPTTHPSILEYLIHELDIVLIMTVNPGFGGQEFLESQFQKISHVRQMIQRYSSKAKIEIDGGVNAQNAWHAQNAGVDILVAGSFVFKAENIRDAIEALKNPQSINDRNV